MAVNRRKLGALLFALVATAAAASAASASHTDTPGVTKKQIVIGGTFPLTGPAALYATIGTLICCATIRKAPAQSVARWILRVHHRS